MKEKAQLTVRVMLIAVGLALIALYGGTTAQPSPPTTSEALEVPLYPDAQVEFELILTEEDFLWGIKKLFEAFLEASRRLPPPPTFPLFPPFPHEEFPPFPHEEEAFVAALLYALGQAYAQAFGEFFQKLLAGLEEFRVVGYSVEVETAKVADFYDQHFAQAGWRRNFWTRQAEVTGRLYSFSQAGRLRAAAFIWIEQLLYNQKTTVLLISVRGN